MASLHYFHHFGKKHNTVKPKRKKTPALVIDITESTEGALPVYLIKIKSQKYRYTDFNKREHSHRFVASNGFVLLSDHCPAEDEMNRPSGYGNPCTNQLFVRGIDSSSDSKVVRAYSLSYVAALKVAVKEYNAYCLGDD